MGGAPPYGESPCEGFNYLAEHDRAARCRDEQMSIRTLNMRLGVGAGLPFLFAFL
jgi:hypothetical protein